jgi:hypothetical protein
MGEVSILKLITKMLGKKIINEFKCLLLLDTKNISFLIDISNTIKKFRSNFKAGNCTILLPSLKEWESN